ncbi:hypothetical protein [Mycobacterium deserti]|uniref:Uncharacterized protein n=1 Tax=Mycobacterium deserti TaxID=2978347 RepID=A0ABT2MFQ8_9MYCO|nr:hypothetical protein [Mycobacterium deserti]MCT7661113.1 hypothetical protein [Mycobacterium deserti]
MGMLGPTSLACLVLAVATIAAIGGYVASTFARRSKRRARGYLILGFCCGLLTGGMLRGRRRRLRALKTVLRSGETRLAALTTTVAASRAILRARLPSR